MGETLAEATTLAEADVNERRRDAEAASSEHQGDSQDSRSEADATPSERRGDGRRGTQGGPGASAWAPFLCAPTALGALTNMRIPLFFRRPVAAPAKGSRPAAAPSLYDSADARKLRDRYTDFLMQEDIRSCIRDALGPVAAILYSEVSVYVWLACLYGVFLVAITSANLFVLQRLLRKITRISAPEGRPGAGAEARPGSQGS